MKEYKDPTVKVIAFSAADVICTSGENTDTSTPTGGNILGGSTPANLGVGGNQQ